MYILPWFPATYQASLRFCPRAKLTMNLYFSKAKQVFVKQIRQVMMQIFMFVNPSSTSVQQQSAHVHNAV